MSLSDAVQEGRRAGLVALRDVLAADIERTDSLRDHAALSQRLMDVLQQIDGLSGGEAKGSPLDELKAKRAARSTAAKSPRRAKSAQPG